MIVCHLCDLTSVAVRVLLDRGIIAAKGSSNWPKVEYLQLSYYNRLSYGLRVKSMDQVIVTQLWIIVVIPIRFNVKKSSKAFC